MRGFFRLTLILLLQGAKLTGNTPTCDFIPNFFGTLLELNSYNVSPGSISIQSYFYGGFVYGYYQDNYSLDSSNRYGVLNPQISVCSGLTERLELDLFIGTQTVFFQGISDTSMNDTILGFAYQPLFDDRHSNIPNLRLILYEIFPTSAHDQTSPDFLGINTSGTGTYGTEIGFTLNKNFYTFPCHPFNLSLNFTYTYKNTGHYRGINYFGGGPYTDIHLRPGGIFWSNLGYEIALSPTLFFCLDLQYVHVLKAHYRGFVGNNFDGSPAQLLTNSEDIFSIAPALEFNITSNFNIYLGGYFTAFGRNTTAQALATIALAYVF